jgi:hypothetical protein
LRVRRWPVGRPTVVAHARDIPPPANPSTIAIFGSGNLGLVYFTRHDHRLPLEELDELGLPRSDGHS